MAITPDNVHEAIAKVVPYELTDHVFTDLYCKVTPETRAIVSQLPDVGLITTFIDRQSGDLWFDIPFCYNPKVAAAHAAKEG